MRNRLPRAAIRREDLYGRIDAGRRLSGEGQSYYRFKRVDAWGYGYGFVSPYDSGVSQQGMATLGIPPIPEGEMK